MTMRRSVSQVASLCALAASLLSSAASADESRGVRASALFKEARELVLAGRYDNACPKFEESLKLDAGLGTEFNLADCWERVGRTDRAAALFARVAEEAHQVGQPERENAARERAERLEQTAATAEAPTAVESAVAVSTVPPLVVTPFSVRAEVQAEYAKLAELDVEVQRARAMARALAAREPHDHEVRALEEKIGLLELSLREAWQEADRVIVRMGRSEPVPAPGPKRAANAVAVRDGRDFMPAARR